MILVGLKFEAKTRLVRLLPLNRTIRVLRLMATALLVPPIGGLTKTFIELVVDPTLENGLASLATLL